MQHSQDSNVRSIQTIFFEGRHLIIAQTVHIHIYTYIHILYTNVQVGDQQEVLRKMQDFFYRMCKYIYINIYWIGN